MANQKEITKIILDAKVVDFDALGKVVSQLGPQVINSDDPWENFCGTMRFFIRIFRLPPIGPRFPDLEQLNKLEGLDREL